MLNCAGPHLLRAEPIAVAALGAGAHYADACGELPHLRRFYEHLHGEARRRKLAVVPGAGFEVAPADCAATLLAGGATVDDVEVFYHFNRMKTSPYTAQGVLKVLQHGGLGFHEGAWRRQRPGRELRTISLPKPPGPRRGISFPSGEIATIPLHVKTRNVSTFLSVPSSVATVAASAAGLLPVIARLGGKRLERRLALQNRGPGERERAATEFALSVRVSTEAETRQAVLRGRDVYGLTAFILAYVAETMLAPGFSSYGVVAPGEVLEAGPFFEALRMQGVFVDAPLGNV